MRFLSTSLNHRFLFLFILTITNQTLIILKELIRILMHLTLISSPIISFKSSKMRSTRECLQFMPRLLHKKSLLISPLFQFLFHVLIIMFLVHFFSFIYNIVFRIFIVKQVRFRLLYLVELILKIMTRNSRVNFSYFTYLKLLGSNSQLRLSSTISGYRFNTGGILLPWSVTPRAFADIPRVS